MFVGGECVFDLEGRLIGLTTSASPLGGNSTQSSVEMVRTYWDNLVAGKNVIGVEVLFYGHDEGTWPAGGGRFELPVKRGNRQ